MLQTTRMADSDGMEPIKYTKKNPFLASLSENTKLSGEGSKKDTRHYVINLSGSRLAYTPGDSLAVTPQNPRSLVDALVEKLGFDPEVNVDHKRCGQTSLREALTRHFIINRAAGKILKALPALGVSDSDRERLEALNGDAEATREYLFTRDYIDILNEFSGVSFDSPESFLELLAPMVPRLYSIASSQAVHPDEVHLLVATVRYETHGRERLGMASGWLADQAELNRHYIPVFATQSKFRLPEDLSMDVIMVGPGTGLAPFRAFLEQRKFDAASGRNWLFFGEQHQSTDFYYQEEMEAFQADGWLHRLDLAFSRDQDHKIYVQDRMRENGAELWAWLKGGAYFYVCGDAQRMAKDVHQALIDIAREHGDMTEEAAVEYVERTLMKEEKRYHRDVY